MKKFVLLLILVALSSLPAMAYHTCDGLITSNNSCIGSESNVESWDNHEPYYTDEEADEHPAYNLNRHYRRNDPRREVPHDWRPTKAAPPRPR